MCTLIALHRRVHGAPLVVAANRDEYFDRPAEALAIRETAAGRVVAPLDVRAGGTWLGLNEHGVFAALTNRRCLEPDPDARSRGLLVTDTLAFGTASDAADALAALPSDTYNPFNFFIADSERAFVATYAGGPEVHEVGPGAHVVGNVPLDETSPKVARVLEQAEKAASAPFRKKLPTPAPTSSPLIRWSIAWPDRSMIVWRPWIKKTTTITQSI